MYQVGTSSWRFMEDDAQFLHLALFMRDAAGLAATRSDDIPPRLAGEVPGQAVTLPAAERGAAAGQWVTWWLRRAAPCALSRWPLTRPPARQLLHDVFTTGRGRT